ncbi:MAG: hypothetical protein V9G04_08450 [Nocardioides sp.]|jgi:hypothetical protein
MSRRFALTVATTGCLALPLVPSATAATAEPHSARNAVTFSISIPAWQRVSGCVEHPFTYSVSGLDTYPFWDVRIAVQNTEGGGDGQAFFYSRPSLPRPPTGTSTVYLCSGDEPGTYAVTGTMTYRTEATGSTDLVANLPATTFEVHNAATTTQLKLKKARRGKIKLRAASAIVSSGGENKPYASATIRVQYRYHKMWVKLPKGNGSTNYRGEFAKTVKLPKGAKRFRAVVNSGDFVDGSTSKVVRLR